MICYLLVVDYYSRYVKVALLEELNTRRVVLQMKSIFPRHGIPEVLRSNNGPRYALEEFRKCVHEYGFQHVMSFPKYPQRAVQTMKSLFKKKNDPYMALLVYRTSPLENGASPAELLMGRK